MTVITVDDADAHYARSNDAGADIIEEPVDQFYGVREYGARDPEASSGSSSPRLTEAETLRATPTLLAGTRHAAGPPHRPKIQQVMVVEPFHEDYGQFGFFYELVRNYEFVNLSDHAYPSFTKGPRRERS